MRAFRTVIAAGALAFAAGEAAATTDTTDLTFGGFAAGSRNLKVHYDSGDGTVVNQAVSAGGFSMSGTNPAESFVAWCLDIFSELLPGPETYRRESFLSTDAPDQLSRAMKVVDANYGRTGGDAVLGSRTNSAAFQVALWDAIYDTDWDASAFGGTGVGFRISRYGGTGATVHQSVLDQAAFYLTEAKDWTVVPNWEITQLASDDTQNLIRVTENTSNLTSPVPLPAGALLIGSAFLGAGALTARRRRRR